MISQIKASTLHRTKSDQQEKIHSFHQNEKYSPKWQDIWQQLKATLAFASMTNDRNYQHGNIHQFWLFRTGFLFSSPILFYAKFSAFGANTLFSIQFRRTESTKELKALIINHLRQCDTGSRPSEFANITCKLQLVLLTSPCFPLGSVIYISKDLNTTKIFFQGLELSIYIVKNLFSSSRPHVVVVKNLFWDILYFFC